MASTLSYYASWLFAGLFGYVIPFWLWGLLGLAGAIAVFLLVPALVPERLRMALAGCVLLLGAILSAGAWGINHGIITERMKWARIVGKEKLRLQLEAQKELSNEQKRTAEAEAASKELEAQLEAITADVADDSNCPVAIPEPAAQRLHNLTGRRR